MKKVRLHLKTVRREGAAAPRCGGDNAAFSPEDEDTVLDCVLGPTTVEEPENETDTMELTTEATLTETDDGRIAIRYAETELSGMEGTDTEISFRRDDPDLVVIRRSGTVRNTLVLERGKFHTGLYETPIMPLEITTAAWQLENHLTMDGGTLFADYTLRIGTISTARTAMTLRMTVPDESLYNTSGDSPDFLCENAFGDLPDNLCENTSVDLSDPLYKIMEEDAL